jgi:uncharacterized protein YjiS (DUF1127 family)
MPISRVGAAPLLVVNETGPTMRAFPHVPLSPKEIEAVRRRAADLRFGAYRDAFRALGRGLRFLAAPLTRRRALARALAELKAMSDYELADIGLARSDLSLRRLASLEGDATLARNQPRTTPPRPANANRRRRTAA